MKLAGLITLASTALVFGIAATASQGCTTSTGNGLDGGLFDTNAPPNDSGGTDTTVPTDSGTPPTDGGMTQGCADCLFLQCSGQEAVCEQDPSCTAIENCLTADPTSLTTCYCDNAAGQA